MIRRMNETISEIYTIGSVTSADGTTIGYRQLGQGPGVVLIHGGMQASQNFMKLATAPRDTFTVYVPDRRGRGRSGPFGDNYGLDKECEDLDALLGKTGASNVFGLSSGAVIALKAALSLSGIRKVAIYEPPLITDRSSPMAWVPRYKQELAEGKLASAMITVIKGTGDVSPFALVPRPLLVPLVKLLIRSNSKQPRGDDVPIEALIPTLEFDIKLVEETEGILRSLRTLRPKALLLGGSKSAPFLLAALDELKMILPDAKRVEFNGIGHLAADNGGKPELVAQELRSFFAG